MPDKKRNREHKDGERSEEFDRFENLTRKLLKVSKEELYEERLKHEQERGEKRAG